jgi:Rrf2 family protein
MRLSKTSEYALRVLSFMINSDTEMFSAKFLIKKLSVPDKYLRRLMTDLRKKGFISSVQGREGGYVFAKGADTIFLSEVIDAVEGMDKYRGCVLGFGKCSDNNPCSLHTKYAPIRNELIRFLSTTTISELKNGEVLRF